MYYDLRKEKVEATLQSLIEISGYLDEKITGLREKLPEESNALGQIIEEFRSSCVLSEKEIRAEHIMVSQANESDINIEDRLSPSDWLSEYIIKLRLTTYPFIKALIDFLPDEHLSKAKINGIWLEGREQLPVDKKDEASPVWELSSKENIYAVKEAKSEKKIELKDLLTLIVAILALVISFVGFYYANLLESDSLQTRIIGRYVKITKLDSNKSVNNLVLQLAFFNDGNRPAIINSISACVSKDSVAQYYTVVSDTAKTFPLLIQSHDVKLVNYVINASALLSLYDNGVITTKQIGENNYETASAFFMHLEYKTVDSKGRVHGVKGPVNITFAISKNNGVTRISNPISYKVKQEALDIYADNIKDL